MKNEEKAKQIARGLTANDDYPHDYLSAFAGAIQAMKWKDQQFIDNACEWLNEQAFGGWIEEPVDEFIEEFKKAMKGE